jgi:hypothetical protein
VAIIAPTVFQYQSATSSIGKQYERARERGRPISVYLMIVFLAPTRYAIGI